MSTLLSQLQAYCASDALPMHMPGHKRNMALAPYLNTLGAGLDVTEIDGFSDLHDPAGPLAKRMEAAAALWGSRRAWWLVGGSTAGILSGIFALTDPGDEVIMARNCHRSVYHALLLRGLTPHYIYPAPYPGRSFSGPVTPADVDAAFTAHPAAKLLILTSPTYEGVTCDVAAVTAAAHRHGAAVLVDEAHGAHFGLSPAFPPSAVTQGADLVVQSLHKTLPSLTQTGLLHLCTDHVDPMTVQFWLQVFQTSSPSYLLMASIDSCVTLLRDKGPELYAQWSAALSDFRIQTNRLRHLTVLPVDDPSKLVISTQNTPLSGPDLARRLRETYHIEPEMAAADYVIAMTGLGDTAGTLTRLSRALCEIDGTLTAAPAGPGLTAPEAETVLPMSQALSAPAAACAVTAAAGEISADFLWAYPPGIPLVTPGERVSGELAEYARSCGETGVTLQSARGGFHIVKNT